jgi:DUF1680 family protein
MDRHKSFGEDYELPNDGYYESCAACGLADFASRMFLLDRRAESADVLERVLCNAILHGISLDGTNTYYCNPLNDHDHLRDNCWVCCQSLSRSCWVALPSFVGWRRTATRSRLSHSTPWPIGASLRRKSGWSSPR